MFTVALIDICYTLISQVDIMGYVSYVAFVTNSHATVMSHFVYCKKKKKKMVVTPFLIILGTSTIHHDFFMLKDKFSILLIPLKLVH
jgi:hypothetical protein